MDRECINGPMNDRFRSKCWAKQLVLLWSVTTYRRFHRKFQFTWEQKWLVTAQNSKRMKTVLTLKLSLSQYHKSGSTFSSSEPVAASSNCSRLGNTLCLQCLPVQPAQALLERSPNSSAIYFAVKPSTAFSNSLREWLPDDRQGLELRLGLKLELCRQTNWL